MWASPFVFALRAPAPVPAHIVLPCSVVALNLNGSYQLTMYKRLCDIMDKNKDSLRFYYLGNKYQSKIEHFGCKNAYLPEDNIIL